MPMKTYVKCGVDELKKDDRIIYDDGEGSKSSTTIESVTAKTNSGLTTAKMNIPAFQEYDVTHSAKRDISQINLFKLVKVEKGKHIFENHHISDFKVGDKILVTFNENYSPNIGTITDIDTIIVPSRNYKTQDGPSIEIMSHMKRALEVRVDNDGSYRKIHEQLYFQEMEFD